MERASDIIRKIWVICSEGGGVEDIFFLSFFFFFCVRQDNSRQDTVRFLFQRVGRDLEMVYLNSPTCPYTYLHVLLMTPKYTSLTSKFSIFVGVRVNQRLQGGFRYPQVCHTHTPTHTLSNERTMGILVGRSGMILFCFLFVIIIFAVSVI